MPGQHRGSDYLTIVEQGRLQEFIDALLLPGPGQPAGLVVLTCITCRYFSHPDACIPRQPDGLVQSERVYHCPSIPLPGDWETYLAGIDKKQRHEIRRKLRRLETSGVPSRWYLVKDAAALDAEYDAFTLLMEQDDDKVRFLTPRMREFFRSVVHWAFDKGILHLASWRSTAVPLATWPSTPQPAGIISGHQLGPLEYSPGWVLLSFQLQWANEQKRLPSISCAATKNTSVSAAPIAFSRAIISKP
jgi:hypothetical protein